MKKESQEIRKFNLKVQIELSKAIQSTKEIDVILKDFSDAHDASVDIKATAKCFWELKVRQLI